MQQNFNKKQINFSRSKDINQQFTAFTDIFQNTMNNQAPFRTLAHKEVKLRKNMDYNCIVKINKNQNKLYSIKIRNSFDESTAKKYKLYKNKLVHVKEVAKKLYYNNLRNSE